MGKDASIAPKERINITFKPATGNAQEEIELPLKVLVLGDFLNRFDERALGERKPVNINKSNFADVMTKQQLGIEIAVPNRLLDTDEGSDISMKLSFQSMRDFEPENIVRQVPEVNKLLALREALVSLKGPLGNLPAFRKAIEEVLADERQRDAVMKEMGLSADDIKKMKSALDNKETDEPDN